MKTIEFTNCKGERIQLRADMTLADLVRAGITFSMQPIDAPMPTDPKMFVNLTGSLPKPPTKPRKRKKA